MERTPDVPLRADLAPASGHALALLLPIAAGLRCTRSARPGSDTDGDGICDAVDNCVAWRTPTSSTRTAPELEPGGRLRRRLRG